MEDEATPDTRELITQGDDLLRASRRLLRDLDEALSTGPEIDLREPPVDTDEQQRRG